MDLILLKSFDNPIDAHLLRIELENEGIESFIFDEHTVTMNPLYSYAIGGIKVKVFRKDAETAKKVLFPESNQETNKVICPNCESTDILLNYKSMKGLKGVFSAFVSLFLGTYPLYFKTVHKCKVCYTEFKSKLTV